MRLTPYANFAAEKTKLGDRLIGGSRSVVKPPILPTVSDGATLSLRTGTVSNGGAVGSDRTAGQVERVTNASHFASVAAA